MDFYATPLLRGDIRFLQEIGCLFFHNVGVLGQTHHLARIQVKVNLVIHGPNR